MEDTPDRSTALVHLVLDPDEGVGPLLALLDSTAAMVFVTASGATIPDGTGDSLAETLASRPLAATASPLHVPHPRDLGLVLLDGERAEQIPSHPSPDPSAVVIRISALRSCAALPSDRLPWSEWLHAWGHDAVRIGWRHVAAPSLVHPGPSLRPTPVDRRQPRWLDRYERHVAAPGNPALERAVGAARRDLGIATIAIDARELSAEPRTGTQQLLLHLIRAMGRARPHQTLTLLTADPTEQARARLAGVFDGPIDPIGPDRWQRLVRSSMNGAPAFDLVYRAHQVANPSELRELRSIAGRLVVGQLDTIAHANPWYHTNGHIFFRSRNLLYATMALADGVTVISEFARESLLDEAPAVEPARVATVLCGTDHLDIDDPHAPIDGIRPGFVLSLGAAYAHKNRSFTVRVFDALCRSGFEGELVLAGPHPPVGNDDEAVGEAVRSTTRAHGDRVHVLGAVSAGQRAWLLANAGVVLYPSVVEGYGLIPFEAASLGTPTLTMGGGALAEMLGLEPDAAHWDPERAAAEIRPLLDDPARRAAAVEAVQTCASRTTWIAAAETTWEHLDRVLGMPRRNLGARPEGGAREAVLRVRVGQPLWVRVLQQVLRVPRRIRRAINS